MITIITYITSAKKKPFEEWFDRLDVQIQSIVISRMARVRLGNFGDCKVIKSGGGISELRIDFGSGYRIYYGKDKETVVILLVGGDKKTQLRDIAKAKQYWLDYKGLLDE